MSLLAQGIFIWNCDGIRAAHRRLPGFLQEAVEGNAAVLLQEAKVSAKTQEKILDILPERATPFLYDTQGYAGVAAVIANRFNPIVTGVDPKRLQRVEFRNEKVQFYNVYAKNSGEGLKSLEERLKEFDPWLAKQIEAGIKEHPAFTTVIAGDFNAIWDCRNSAFAHPDAWDPARPSNTEAESQSLREWVKRLQLQRVPVLPKGTVRHSFYGDWAQWRKRKGLTFDYILAAGPKAQALKATLIPTGRYDHQAMRVTTEE